VVVYDTGAANGPVETAEGNHVADFEVVGQYVRHWCGRSTLNGGVHFLEIDVYGVRC
jgi:hypothetical protein